MARRASRDCNSMTRSTMAKTKRKIILPTPEEDAAIRAAIAEDPDTFELDDEWFREARPLKRSFLSCGRLGMATGNRVMMR